MRTFKHFAVWTFCGFLVVAIAGAFAGGVVGASVAVATRTPSIRTSFFEVAFIGAFIGSFYGAYSGGACGAIALWVLAFLRPPLQNGAKCLSLALRIIAAYVVAGTTFGSVGLAIVGFAVVRVFPALLPSGRLFDVFEWIVRGHFVLVAVPAIGGAVAAARAMHRFETKAARAAPIEN